MQDSITLNETVCAERAVVGDYDNDGIPDITVKFDREQVCALLETGDAVEITVSGSLGDVRFSGTDTIRVIGKYKPSKKIETPVCEPGGNTDKVCFYHLDHLGTPQAITDEDGNILWQADYKPFGEASVTTGDVKNNFRFPGQYLDEETGLHYNWHRYYDPATGRYLTPDPIGLEGGINLYGYALNDPANMTDPSGLDPVDPNTGERSEVMGCHHTEKLPEGTVGYLLILLDIADLPSGEGIIPGIGMILGKKGTISGVRIAKIMRSQKIAPDLLDKGVHFNIGKIELKAVPNHLGGISLKPVHPGMASRNPEAFDKALKMGNEALNSEEFRAWLAKHAQKGFEMASQSGNAKALEFKFLIDALKRMK